jgi:glucose-6-phosphate 1-dehydrogenase
MSNPGADPCVLVIFGASGDLARSKLLPAIYNLAESGHLPDDLAILGVARSPVDRAAYQAQMRDAVAKAEAEPLDPATWKRIEDRLFYLYGEFDDPALFEQLRHRLQEICEQHRLPPNYLFYLAVPPDLFGAVVGHLTVAALTKEDGGWRRVVVEKPFGYDLESARALDAKLRTGLHEPQIYRIDHYLGKETVQNILAFRFANGIFEPIWNRRYVDHVQMTVAEEAGIGRRGGYYDKAGALRDIVQNHMVQVLTLVAMEPPISFAAEDIRDEKVKVLHAVPSLAAVDVNQHVVRAQYAGYREEPDVDRASRTETFVAMRMFVDNWRWAGVPMYLRTGKKLPARVTEVVVQFKCPPLMLFRETPVHSLNANRLVLRIQPDEGISLSFEAKVPGPFESLETVTMNFGYAEHFKTEPLTGYETLLFDAMAGDQTLFHRMDMVEAGWQIVSSILEAWKQDTRSPVATYQAGTAGPSEADLLMNRDGRAWRD